MTISGTTLSTLEELINSSVPKKEVVRVLLDAIQSGIDKSEHHQGVNWLWWVAYSAYLGYLEPFQELLKSNGGKLHGFDLNAVPIAGANQGKSLLWYATKVANKGNPELLQSIIEANNNTLDGINKNTAPNSEYEKNQTILWVACYGLANACPMAFNLLLAANNETLKGFTFENKTNSSDAPALTSSILFWAISAAIKGEVQVLEKLCAAEAKTTYEKSLLEPLLQCGLSYARYLCPLMQVHDSYDVADGLLTPSVICEKLLLDTLDYEKSPLNKEQSQLYLSLLFYIGYLQKIIEENPGILEKEARDIFKTIDDTINQIDSQESLMECYALLGDFFKDNLLLEIAILYYEKIAPNHQDYQKSRCELASYYLSCTPENEDSAARSKRLIQAATYAKQGGAQLINLYFKIIAIYYDIDPFFDYNVATPYSFLITSQPAKASSLGDHLETLRPRVELIKNQLTLTRQSFKSHEERTTKYPSFYASPKYQDDSNNKNENYHSPTNG